MAQMTNIKANNEFNHAKLIEIFSEINVSAFLDKWGPEKVVQVYDPDINMQGILVIDNTVLGPGNGGIKISPTITPREVFQSARTRTWTCALANLPFGGAKSGIRADPFKVDKTQYIRSFAKRISPYVSEQYIATPDIGVGQEEIAEFVEEIVDRRGATGKPEKMDGIPQELGTTGFGVGVAIEVSLNIAHSLISLPKNIYDIKVAIQGFENVDSTIAKYLTSKGAKIVAISDYWSTIYSQDGIEIESVLKYSGAVTRKHSVKNYKPATILPKEDIIKVDCDIFVSASGRNAITEETTNLLKAKYVAEGIDNPITPTTDQLLYQKGVFVLPNILTDIGSAVSSYAECNRKGVETTFTSIESRVKEVTELVVQRSLETNIPIRRVAKEIAKERILDAMEEE